MVESIFAENMFGIKSYYLLDVISKSENEKELIIKIWNGKYKRLKLDEKKKCYIAELNEMEEIDEKN